MADVMGADDFFAAFGPHAATVAAVAAKMIRLKLSPEDVLRLYDAHVEAMAADMIPATPEERDRAAGRAAPPDPDTRRPEGQADTEHRLGACPQCGAEVWGIKKCPHISPPWRTFLACDNDACGYHGKSRLTVDVLRRQWPVGVEED